MRKDICKTKWVAILLINICMIIFFGVVSLAKTNVNTKDYEYILSNDNDDETYKSFKISNGYARLEGTKMVVMKDVEASFESSQIIECSTSSSLKEILLNDIKENMSDKQKEIIFNDNSYNSDELGADLFCNVTSVLFGNDNINYFKNTTDKVVQLDDYKQQQLLKKFHNIDTQSYIVNCAATIEGCNMIPTELYIYVKLTKIIFNDGYIIRIFNTDAPLILQENLSNEGFIVKSIKSIEMEPIN